MERPVYNPPVFEANPDATIEEREAHAEAVQQYEADFKAALAAWEAARYAAEEQAPRHARCGSWLRANPVAGVECVDRQDGLGPRLVGWPEGMPHPDFATFAAAKEAERAALTSQRDADKATINNWDNATAAEKWAVVGRFLKRSI